MSSKHGKTAHHRADGRRALQKGDLGTALEAFEEASKGEPTDARNWLHMAEVQSRLGNREAAVEAYRQAGRLHTRAGFFRHAVAIYKSVLALAPGDLDAHHNLAELYRHLGLISDATAQYEYVIRACQITDRSQEALQALKQIAALNPNDVRIQLRIVDLSSELGLRDDVVPRLRMVADLLRASGRIDEYLRVAERLLREQPGNFILARDMAKAYLVRGNGRVALARLKMCFDSEPRDTETLELLANAFELCGERAKAVRLLRALACIHRDQGRKVQCLDAIHRALDIDPGDGETRALLDEVSGAPRRHPSIEIPVDMGDDEGDADADAPVEAVSEEQTLKTHMPGFVSSQELRAIDPGNPAEVMDLFPAEDARRLAGKAQKQLDDVVGTLRRLLGLLPAQMSSRLLLESSLDALAPGGELATELALLEQTLGEQKWVNELGDVEQRLSSERTRLGRTLGASRGD